MSVFEGWPEHQTNAYISVLYGTKRLCSISSPPPPQWGAIPPLPQCRLPLPHPHPQQFDMLLCCFDNSACGSLDFVELKRH